MISNHPGASRAGIAPALVAHALDWEDDNNELDLLMDNIADVFS